MGATHHGIPEVTIETLSRGFYREAAGYGFGHIDYVRFVNHLLDLAGKNGGGAAAKGTPRGIRGPEAEQLSAVTPSDLPLQGERVVVRALDSGRDFGLLSQWLNDREGRHFLLSCATAQRASITELVGRPDCIFGIITLRDSTPIGSMAYLNTDRVQRKAELRKLIGEPTERGKGLAKEASELWIQYGLRTLGLKKIYLSTLETDIRNVRLNEDLGFRVEGVLRNEVFIDGTYRDVLRMGIWAD